MSDIKDNLSEKEIVYYKINFLKLLYINDKRYYKCMDYHTFTYPKLSYADSFMQREI